MVFIFKFCNRGIFHLIHIKNYMHHSLIRRVIRLLIVNMKTCLILCALFGINLGFEFRNPFAKKNKTETVTQQLPKEIVQKCFENYTELGCFTNDAPWRTFFRPFPMPISPKEIDAKIYLYTSKYPDQRFTVKLWKNISINESDFDPQRPRTAFITHGFSSDGNVSWVKELKDAYLAQRDANVFIVDWGKGANNWNYMQVAANTRVVGAELKRFISYLVEAWHLDPIRIHFMGHSLGAHISAYAAKGIPGIGQLTAFDPAQPGFEGSSAEVRLTKNDAKFIDVIHTNIRPSVPFLGFGLILPTGHVDYYMNGGALQPDCIVPQIQDFDIKKFESIDEILEDPEQFVPMVQMYAKLLSAWVACSHGKAYTYYIEALLKNNCTFWGRSTSVFGTLLDIATLGRAATTWEDFDECTLNSCSPIGLESEEYPARGSFSVGTREESPYCQNNPNITEIMIELLRKKLQGNEEMKDESNGVWKFIKDIFKPYF